HEPPFWMLVPSGLLVLTCLVVGIFPMYTLGPLLESATLSILGSATPNYDLKIWHGFNLPLVMSLTALAGGILLLHLLRHQNHVKPGVAPLIYRFDGRRTFELLMEGVDSLSASLLDRLYSPGLQR